MSAVGDLVPITPSGMLVYDGEPHTDDWYAVRRQGITGTDLPKILGLTKYGNSLSVWRDKRGEAEDKAGEAAKWGTLQEPIVADVWAADNGTTVQPVGVIAHINHSWIRASLDRLVDACPIVLSARCGLEIKTRNAYVAGKWREEVPDDVLAQVQWGLMATDLDHMHVACLIGGQRLQSYIIGRDKELEDYLLAAAEPVWDSVVNGNPPNVMADAGGVLLAELNHMFADREGSIEIDPEVAEPLMRAYREGHRRQGEGEDIKTVAKTGMVKLMNGAAVAVGKEALHPLWTYKRPESKDTMSAPELRRLKAERPVVYRMLVARGYITKTSPNPKFDPKF